MRGGIDECLFLVVLNQSSDPDGGLRAKNVLTTIKLNNDNTPSLSVMCSCFKWTFPNKENNSNVDRGSV